MDDDDDDGDRGDDVCVSSMNYVCDACGSGYGNPFARSSCGVDTS